MTFAFQGEYRSRAGPRVLADESVSSLASHKSKAQAHTQRIETMSGDIAGNLVYVAAAVLLPLIPAYVLYKTLPFGTNVGGPLGGLKLKLSGAFAGYFALVVIVFGFLYSRPEPCPPQTDCSACPKEPYTVYTVYGVLQEIPGEDVVTNTNITLHPKVEILTDGFFQFEVPVQKDRASIRSLEITHQGFKPETIPLIENPPFPPSYSVKYNEGTKTIQIQEEILLKRVPPYSGGTDVTR